ncbi:flagellar hook assembly protein FlgD [Candidatus Arthromitus sp. SFB-turkey]|uniref:flagellar hook assembly protein FlgD n=1 Tax=Candidatus Arthromitus sp. SFB-turkey TaxID=1840217 RepID=UPI0007F54BAE|nr:flagellar hook capping FlgD N-terminal domain-containing protein [Candidatus Arthromitus sp. SFB-turkey]OAT86919.1 flagellar biosynthesis protein FlgD [Candidatus Arthromitus sp. SFB-turkey]HJC99850.1 flagellar biosynthesis protein FlgD [Candidatus Dwaynia gallinarum]
MDISKKIQTSWNSNTKTKMGTSSNTMSENKEFENLLKQLENLENDDEQEIDTRSSSNSRSGNVYGGQTTDRGTKIIQPGEDMDKNAFLRILAAQMANQDPTQPQDGTEYVSQFAQFAAMEQMSNLNNTMSQFASQSLIGKGVMLNAYDKNGNIITGIVRSVSQSGSKILVGVEYFDEKGELVIGEFENNDIANVIDVQDNRLDYINNNMAMLVGSSMIDKNIEFIVSSEESEGNEDQVDNETSDGETTTPVYETMNGIVESVVVENYMIKLRVRVDGSDEVQTVTLDKVIRVDGEKYVNNF